MKTDDLEKRLERTVPREIPSKWREEILGAARHAKTSCHSSPATHHNLLSTLIHRLSALSRPQRAAWLGLAAAWVVIISLNIAARDDSRGAEASHAGAPVSSDTLQALKQQRLLLAELVGRPDRHEADRPKTIVPGPRSQRREESATA